MKKIFTKLMLLAVAAAALVSCENKFDEQTPVVELTQTVTLSADKTAVRTELIEGVPYWSAEDQIGVYVQDSEGYKNYAFKNDNEEASLTTSFTGTTAVANTLFVYYPYTNFNDPVTENGVKVEILANQEPTAASFDGRTDLMIAKPVTLDAEGKQLSDLEFARVAAIVKVVLKDKTGNLAGQHVSSLTMTAANNLVGRVYLDVVNQKINSEKGLYYGGAPSVTATYTEATQYEVDGTNATYVVVYPQTLAAGSKLSFEASTEGYAISKEITLPSDIELLAGKVTTLNVSLAAENVVAEATGLALPVEDDFAWATGTSNVTPSGELWSSDYSFLYGNDGELRLGKSGECGHITTAPLNLSQPFTVVVDAKAWTTKTSQLAVTVGDETKTSANLPSETSGFSTYVFEFDAAGNKESVKIAITGERGFIDNLKVVAGHDYVLPPVLTVNVESITSISHEGEDVTFNYEVANPVEGTSVVITADAEWLTIDDNNGAVTVTVAENTLEEVRNATITVKYGDLTETIAIQQNAKPAEGGNTQTAQYVKVTSTSDITDGQYLIVYETAKIAMNGNLSMSSIDADNNYQKVDITDSTIPSNATTDAMAFTYNATNKSFKSAQGYWIGRTSTSNGLDKSNSSEMKHSTVSISNGNATITSSGGPSLQVYQSGSTYRFRYYKTTQKAIQLYKLVGESGGEGGGSTPEPEPETPVLSVNPTTLNFDAAGGNKTVACTIENEVSGVNVTATESVDWLSTSVSGKTVTVTATANTGAARNATVTIAYTGAESKTVTVSQAAGNTGGGDSGKTSYVLITNINDLTSGEYIMAAYANNKYIALPTNPTVSSGKIVGDEITVTNNEISETDADGYVWTFTKSGNYYTVSDGAKNLYHSKGGTDGTNLEYGTSSSYVWSITYDKAFVFAGVTNNNTVNGRGMLYQIGTVNKFGGYSLSNKSSTSYSQIYLFKKSN